MPRETSSLYSRFKRFASREGTRASIRVDVRRSGHKIRFETRDLFLQVPPPGSATDPSLSGAVLELFAPGQAPEVLTIPPGEGRPGWSVRTSPLQYRFRNSAAPRTLSPVRTFRMQDPPRQLDWVAVPSESALASDTMESLGVRITLGSQRICARFGGTAIRMARPGRFVAEGSALPGGNCSDASLGGP